MHTVNKLPPPAENFPWEEVVPHIVHPIKVAILEAMWWIGEPLSATDLRKVLEGQYSLSLISYHMTASAKLGIVKKVDQRQVRGALESFYFFPLRK